MNNEFRALQKKLSDEEVANDIYVSEKLVVYIRGCNVASADGAKLFVLLKDRVIVPSIVVLACSVTEYFTKKTLSKILKLKEEYPGYQMFITGCMDDMLAEKYSKYGVVIRKNDMWDLDRYII